MSIETARLAGAVPASGATVNHAASSLIWKFSVPVPVLLMSGYLPDEHELPASEVPSLPILQKPFRREELAERIRDVMGLPA